MVADRVADRVEKSPTAMGVQPSFAVVASRVFAMKQKGFPIHITDIWRWTRQMGFASIGKLHLGSVLVAIGAEY
jgi:hypothetical protein